jgi:hypothetical protein
LIFGSKIPVLFLALFFAGGTILTNRALLSSQAYDHRLWDSLSPQLSTTLLPNLALGYSNSYASLLWIKTIAYYGAHLDKSNLLYVSHLLESITTLNSYAEHAYYMAAAAIPWDRQNTTLTRSLVIKAMVYFPKDWRWPYYRGFNAYWFDHDQKTAAHYLTRAATLPGAHPMISGLAARMQAEAGSLDDALFFLESLLRNKQDQAIRYQLERQVKLINTEKILRKFEKTISHLPKESRNMRDLSKLGFFIPRTLPDGGHIVFDDNGTPVSSKSGKRFKIFVPEKKKEKLSNESSERQKT